MPQEQNFLVKLLPSTEAKLNILVLNDMAILPQLRAMLPNADIYAVTNQYSVTRDGAYQSLSVNWIIADYRNEDLPVEADFFEYIIAEHGFSGVGDITALTDRLHAYLKPTGYLLVSCYNARHCSVLQQQAQGDFSLTGHAVLCKEEIRSLFDSVWYKTVDVKGVRMPADEELCQKLAACGFSPDTLTIQQWLIIACREDGNTRQLKLEQPAPVRSIVGTLLRRIECDIESTRNTVDLYRVIRNYNIRPVYIALFIRLITVQPFDVLNNLLPSLLAMPDMAEASRQQAKKFAGELLSALQNMYPNTENGDRIGKYNMEKLSSLAKASKKTDKAHKAPSQLTVADAMEWVEEVPPEKRIAFISCVNDEAMYQEALLYLKHLHIPADMKAEIIPMRQGKSMADAYNQAMHSTKAKYKVYLHQDAYIANKNFIFDLLRIFEDSSVGIVGMAGALQLPPTGVWWNAPVKYGAVLHWQEPESVIPTIHNNPAQGSMQAVEAVDGFLMATQVDIPWRSDICDGWHMYDICQCKDMAKQGYKVVVPHQEPYWCIHRPGIKPLDPLYEKYRRRFLEEYCGDMLVYADETENNE